MLNKAPHVQERTRFRNDSPWRAGAAHEAGFAVLTITVFNKNAPIAQFGRVLA